MSVWSGGSLRDKQKVMKKLISTILFCVVAISATAQNFSITYVAKNAVRVRYGAAHVKSDLPDWL